MPRNRHRPRKPDRASPDLTPMIDVTFQLLIFFILATRFKDTERNFRADLPQDEGPRSDSRVPVEQLTIYCNWDPDSKGTSYAVAIGARGHKPVPDSYAQLDDLVIYAGDGRNEILHKRERYRQIHSNLVRSVHDYERESGAKVEKLEIAFAKDAAQGASSGTAPWMFVSLAVDAANKVNEDRAGSGKEPLKVTFKFADALSVYARGH